MNIRGIDETDRALLALLQKDARMSYSDLGREVGLSRTAVKNRLAALEKRGIIGGYRVVIDPHRIPEQTLFLIHIETRPEEFDRVRQAFAEAPETVTLLQTTGGCHLTAVCTAEDVPAMRAFVNRVYRSVGGLLSVEARTILDVVKGGFLPGV